MNAPNILPPVAMSDSQLNTVLENSLYPGANTQSIAMVIAYCQASALDPMQKPVHIVPMWDSKSSRMRDVIMPGIGLYRTQAARTGQYAGVSEPEFGEDVTEKIDGKEITYPKWCRVTVKRRLADGTIAEFTAREFWRENYAVRGGKEKSLAPNAMWSKRPYAQLAKCAQAQALRIAFPEIGSQPTADEMEGKEIDITPAMEPNKHQPVRAALDGVDVNDEDMAYLRELAEEIVESVEQGKISEAYERHETAMLDADQKLIVWDLLRPNSKVRSALKKEGEMRRAAAKTPPTLAEAT